MLQRTRRHCAPTSCSSKLPADVDAGAALGGRRRPRAAGGAARLGRRRTGPAPRSRRSPSFSPEWQAIAWANAHDGAPSHAIDLPLAITLAHDLERWRSDPSVVEVARRPIRSAISPRRRANPTPNAGGRTSSNTAATAPRRSMPSPRRWPPPGRATWPSSRELQREAHMRRAIRAARRDGHEAIAVVCGAWHVPALDLDGEVTASTVPNASTDAATLRGLPKVEGRQSPGCRGPTAASPPHSGYGAGVDSPGWYRHVFDHPGDRRCGSVLRRRRPTRARPRRRGVARRVDRRHPSGRRRSRRCAGGRGSAWPRCSTPPTP